MELSKVLNLAKTSGFAERSNLRNLYNWHYANNLSKHSN